MSEISWVGTKYVGVTTTGSCCGGEEGNRVTRIDTEHTNSFFLFFGIWYVVRMGLFALFVCAAGRETKAWFTYPYEDRVKVASVV